MKKTGLIITRTAFSIVLAATVAAAASGCGKSSVTTPSAVEETSSSGISSADNSAPDASTSSNAEEALLFGTDDQLPVVFGSTSELSDPLPENAQEDATVSDTASDLSDSGATGTTSTASDLSDSGTTGTTLFPLFPRFQPPRNLRVRKLPPPPCRMVSPSAQAKTPA